MRLLRVALECLLELLAAPLLLVVSLIARFSQREIAVGLGPEPLINNIYHKVALEGEGWSAETFVHEVYHITSNFDLRADLWFGGRWKVVRLLLLHCRALFRYRALYIYFHGSSLGFTRLLWLIEPILLKLAGVKTVIMPYGSDVQDLLRTPNLPFRHVLCQQYPNARWRRRIIDLKIDLWTLLGTHIIGGCDWVDYLYHWDTLMPAHFSIQLPEKVKSPRDHNAPLRVLHAPNHRIVKGSDFFIQAVEELQQEGVAIELELVEKVSNEEVRRRMQEVDLVADQLIIGWYAMFALEAMSMGIPVICYLREDLLSLYQTARVLPLEEHPILSAIPSTIKEVLREAAANRSLLRQRGERSRDYVERFHSTEAVGRVFHSINQGISL